VDLWPESLLKLAYSKLEAAEAEDLLKAFDKVTVDSLDALSKKDIDALQKICAHEELAVLELYSKFTSAFEDQQKTWWSLIESLCRLVNMSKLYDTIPENLMNVVSQTAQDLKEQIDAGKTTLNSLNPFELGQQVMSKFKPEELQELMKSLSQNQGMLTSLMEQMTSSMGPDMSGLLNNLK